MSGKCTISYFHGIIPAHVFILSDIYFLPNSLPLFFRDCYNQKLHLQSISQSCEVNGTLIPLSYFNPFSLLHVEKHHKTNHQLSSQGDEMERSKEKRDPVLNSEPESERSVKPHRFVKY